MPGSTLWTFTLSLVFLKCGTGSAALCPPPPQGECGGPLPARREAGPIGGTYGGKAHEEWHHPRGRIENTVAKCLQREAEKS